MEGFAAVCVWGGDVSGLESFHHHCRIEKANHSLTHSLLPLLPPLGRAVFLVRWRDGGEFGSVRRSCLRFFFPVSVGGGRPGVDDDDDVGERRSLPAINEEI